MTERIINRFEREYKKLELVANALELASPNGAKYRVEPTYLDFGQDWKWTTIVRYGYEECQILSPRQWKEIMMAESMEDFTAVVNDIRNGEWFGDK